MTDPFGDDWDPEPAEIEAMGLERSLHAAKTSVELAEHLIEEASPQAVHVILRIMNSSTANERTRLDAAKYILDRTIGKPGDPKSNGSKQPWDDIFGSTVVEAEAILASTGEQDSK